MSTGGVVPSVRSLALVNFTVQRASRSLCASFAGFVAHAAERGPP